ncbi:MAG: ABC transporter ATP-binding protein [Chloroflexi bacterium]|nr:ABC transporter ATP-binding protein [Chloroflexota bacterium]
MIRFDHVSKTYVTEADTVHALRDVTLEIAGGEFVAIMGQSGSGKSTMMNIIGCLDRPTSGSYSLEGHDVGRLPDAVRAKLRGRAFGFIFQSYNLLPRLSAIEQVELPLIYQRVPNRRALAAEALARVGLADRAHHGPTQLSGGQQQRVAIARSLVVNPRVILADEPTGALDTKTGGEVMTLLSKLVDEQGITVVVVTHEQSVADYTRRALRMRDGTIIEDTGRPALRTVNR